MVKSNRAYKSSKRSRELARQKKQEEKRLRRLARHLNPSADDAAPVEGQEQEPEPGVETPEKETPETD
ncbi:MAG: hypothetical protein ABR951_01750 [Candidatus Aminicenantales bacterium]